MAHLAGFGCRRVLGVGWGRKHILLQCQPTGLWWMWGALGPYWVSNPGCLGHQSVPLTAEPTLLSGDHTVAELGTQAYREAHGRFLFGLEALSLNSFTEVSLADVQLSPCVWSHRQGVILPSSPRRLLCSLDSVGVSHAVLYPVTLSDPGSPAIC